MKKKRHIMLVIMLGALVFQPLGTSMGAPDTNTSQASLRGNTVSYDSNTGVLEAEGEVLLTHGNASVSGEKAQYNTKTRQGSIQGSVIAVRDSLRMTADAASIDGEELQATGNVNAVQEDMTLRAASVRTAGKNRYIAEGNVYGTQADKTFSGAVIDYEQDTNHILATSGGTVTSADGTFSADHLEGWLNEARYKGIGNAHIVSPPKHFEGGGDVADYYGQADASGRARCILDGNAWAYQDNNFLSGSHLILYLDENQRTVVESN